MDGLSIFFIFFFGIAALMPVLWAIGAAVRGDSGYWPTFIGAGFAIGLLLVTFIGIGRNWGGCSLNRSDSSKGAIKCAIGDNLTGCEPDVWKLECRQPAGCKDPIVPGAFCPKNQKPVFPFCERIQFGRVRQPWATWSDLSFVAAGLWILWGLHYFATGGTLGTEDNPMRQIGLLSITYGFIIIFMGPPSQWFHASMQDWGGWFDTMSVVAWLTFNAVYVIYTLVCTVSGKGRGLLRTIIVFLIWAGLLIICGFIAIAPERRLYLYFVGGVPWGLAEVLYLFFVSCCKGVTYRRTWWLFVINLVLLGVTMTIWIFFNDGIVSATACQGREGIPGHAFFHILASFSTILTFLSFASERRVSS